MANAGTTSGALKAVIEAAGIGVSAFKDRVAPSKEYPYVTIMERVAFVPDTSTSTFDNSIIPGFIETAQVDLWQKWREIAEANANIVEDRTLAKKLIRALHGKRLYISPTSEGTIADAKTWGVRVINNIRLLEEDVNIVHDAITITISQELY